MNQKKISEVFAKTNYKCAYCGKDLDMNVRYKKVPIYKVRNDHTEIMEWTDVIDVTSINYAIEHIKPVSKGGGNNIENLLPSCKKCNISKGTKNLEEFRLHLTLKNNNIPPFKKEQIDYLKSKINLSEIFPPMVTFYFETLKKGDEK